jgi:hypothetical protein
VKITASFVTGLVLISCLAAKADSPEFGNSPNGNGTAFDLSTYGQLSLSGGAVGFTPDANIELSSVSLWLTGYTGQSGQTIDVSIWDNSTSNSHPWAPVISLSAALPNNGSLAEFTFSSPSANSYNDPSGSMVLSANTEYWLVVTAGAQPGNCTTDASWVNGIPPTGNAIFDASETYNVNGGSFDPNGAMPAFSINSDAPFSIDPVPEPGSASIMSLAMLFGMTGWLWKRHKENSKKLAPVKSTECFRKRPYKK